MRAGVRHERELRTSAGDSRVVGIRPTLSSRVCGGTHGLCATQLELLALALVLLSFDPTPDAFVFVFPTVGAKNLVEKGCVAIAGKRTEREKCVSALTWIWKALSRWQF